MKPENVEKRLKAGNTFMNRWRTDFVKVSDITWSGARIKIEEENKVGYLLICCIDPVEVHGVVKVKNATLNLEYNGDKFSISDPVNNFKVLCHDIEFKEVLNPKP